MPIKPAPIQEKSSNKSGFFPQTWVLWFSNLRNTISEIEGNINNGTDNHDNLANNGGTGSHAAIASHISDSTIHFSSSSLDHGSISGLEDDDHTQYHTDARGDARYFTKGEYKDVSSGSVDAESPIKLGQNGLISETMLYVDVNDIVPLSASFTYDSSGNISTITKDGVTKTFTYNTDGTVNNIDDGVYLKTFNYNTDGTINTIVVS